MEIVEGIHRVDEASANMAHSNVYLLIEGDELTVIDTGTAGNAKKIVDYVQKIGRQPSNVSTIILTHCHMDRWKRQGTQGPYRRESGCSRGRRRLCFRQKAPA